MHCISCCSVKLYVISLRFVNRTVLLLLTVEYSTRCPHCKQAAPVFNQLAEKYNINKAKAIIRVAKVITSYDYDALFLHIIYIFTARCYASAVLAMALCLSVCPSVCPSVTSRCSTKTAKRRITQTTPHDTPARDSSFLKPKISAKFEWGHPLRGRQMQVGSVKIGDF